MVLFGRLLKVDAQQASETLQAVENKISLLFRFLGDEDDDVSGAVATFTTDYISLLKQMNPLSQKQRENIEVCMFCVWLMTSFMFKLLTILADV